jgi:hypothetical protein
VLDSMQHRLCLFGPCFSQNDSKTGHLEVLH